MSPQSVKTFSSWYQVIVFAYLRQIRWLSLQHFATILKITLSTRYGSEKQISQYV